MAEAANTNDADAIKAPCAVDCSWVEIREGAGDLQDAYYACFKDVESVNAALKELNEAMAEGIYLKEKMAFYERKLAKANKDKEDKKIKKYEKKLASAREQELAVDEKLSLKKDAVKHAEELRDVSSYKRDTIKEELQMRMKLCKEKWVTFLGSNDVAALRFMKDFGNLGVTFTIGKSVTSGNAARISKQVSDLTKNELKDVKIKQLYQLTKEGTFRALTAKEMDDLKFKR